MSICVCSTLYTMSVSPSSSPPLTVELIGVRWRLHRVWEGGSCYWAAAGRSLRYFLTFADDRIGTCSSIRRVKPCQRLKAHSCVVGDFFQLQEGSHWQRCWCVPYLQKKVGPANIWKGLPILRSWKGKRDERQSPLGSFHTNRGQFDKENSPLHSCLIKYIHTYITNIVQNVKMWAPLTKVVPCSSRQKLWEF